MGNTGGSFVFGLGGTLKPWVLGSRARREAQSLMMAMMVECMAGATSVTVGATAPLLCRTRMSSFAFPDAFLVRIPSVGRGRGSWSKVSCGLSPHSLRVIAKGLGIILRRKSEFINVLVSFLWSL